MSDVGKRTGEDGTSGKVETRSGPPRTIHGHDFGECASALQKCIRRGMEDDALHWAVELDRSGFGEFVFKRLRVIAMEDIGIADPNVIVQVQALYEVWTDLRRKRDDKQEPWRLALVQAVIVLSRAAKSRITDHALLAHYLTDERREVPDFAVDKHTLAGRKRGRSWRFFWQDSTMLINHTTGELEAAPVLRDDYRPRAIKATGGGR